MKSESIIVDGIRYIREDLTKKSDKAKTMKGKPYVIVRTYSAGEYCCGASMETINSGSGSGYGDGSG